MALITQYTEHGVKMKMHVILRKTTGAEGGSRTRTTLRSTDFKSVASAIPPPRHVPAKIARHQNSRQTLQRHCPVIEIDHKERCWLVQPSTPSSPPSFVLVRD